MEHGGLWHLWEQAMPQGGPSPHAHNSLCHLQLKGSTHHVITSLTSSSLCLSFSIWKNG